MCEKALCIIEFEDADKAIEFANKTWPHLKEYAESLREVDIELDEDKRWLCIIGICDICGVKEAYFIPACAFSDGIFVSECSECGNMSMYPQEIYAEQQNKETGDEES